MALISIKSRRTLGMIDVLAPERYDPRRAIDASAAGTTLLGDVVTHERTAIQPSTDLGRCLVLDTSDAREGIVIARKTPVAGHELGSAKKVIELHDVIISRLRPYLRQVAFVDSEIPGAGAALLVCSTEFFVLRSRDEHSIAFLIPFLLSRQVQEVLAASQEGGHHPRFDDSALLTLPLPVSLLSQRQDISATTEKAVSLYRKCERQIDDMTAKAEAAFA